MSIKRLPIPAVDDPAIFDVPVASAIKALSAGAATEHQQRLAYDWILKSAAGVGAQSFRIGDSHATAFMEGRRFVASQLIALQSIDIDKLKKKDDTNG